MSKAIGFAALIIVFGIFMPDVLRALSAFLLAFLDKATVLIQSMPSH